ncbi:MAG: PEGA domain-containing protein, partial [Candidatus Atribacteria bacterium]|nr:PEGA domain-containing protein [Candidatus Atribacteria bacterium]
YGSIAIRCNKEDARIYLDGQYKGLTEKNESVILEQVKEGYHEVKITLSDHIDWSREIEVKQNQRIQLNVTLEKEKENGRLEITCNVDNARIYLDGKYQKRTSSNRSVVIDNIEEGKYELRITKEGYRDYIDTINVYADHTYHVDVTMQSEDREGSIAINCNENNAKIFINGIYKATTSVNQAKVIDDLKEGLYEITVIKDGYHTWLDEVRVYSGETSSVFVDLMKIKNE